MTTRQSSLTSNAVIPKENTSSSGVELLVVRSSSSDASGAKYFAVPPAVVVNPDCSKICARPKSHRAADPSSLMRTLTLK